MQLLDELGYDFILTVVTGNYTVSLYLDDGYFTTFFSLKCNLKIPIPICRSAHCLSLLIVRLL